MLEIDERLRKIIAYCFLVIGIMLIIFSFGLDSFVLRYTKSLPVMHDLVYTILNLSYIFTLGFMYNLVYNAYKINSMLGAVIIFLLYLIPGFIIERTKKSKELEELEKNIDKMEKTGELKKMSNDQVRKLEDRLAVLSRKSNIFNHRLFVLILVMLPAISWYAGWIRDTNMIVSAFFGFYYTILSVNFLRK